MKSCFPANWIGTNKIRRNFQNVLHRLFRCFGWNVRHRPRLAGFPIHLATCSAATTTSNRFVQSAEWSFDDRFQAFVRPRKNCAASSLSALEVSLSPTNPESAFLRRRCVLESGWPTGRTRLGQFGLTFSTKSLPKRLVGQFWWGWHLDDSADWNETSQAQPDDDAFQV